MVGKYAILEEVQAGGMGIVYKAHDTELDRIVALKMIKGGLLATTEEIVRFRHEARAAARLDHPNIVPVHDIGEEEGRLYFTMAFAWGGSLSRRLSCFVADPRAAAALAEKVARAVHYAHEKGILHRDLKPGNILFDERGTPWVGDFGLAKFVDGSLELTRPGQPLGTPAYMAPEQASGHTDRISPRTDVWALGVLLYELLTGCRPFKGESQEEQLRKVRTGEPPRPRAVNRSLDRALETVTLKCLEKEPARRYASAEAVADDLARWLRGEPVLVRPPSWPLRAWRVMHRYRRLTFRLGVTAVLLALLWLAWRGVSPSLPPDEVRDAEQLEVMGRLSDRLRKGEKVLLLGESGPPLASRWQPRRLQARTMLDLNQVFRVYAGEHPGMLELLSAVPKRFRLRAQVQHCDSLDLQGQPWGHVGIYFAHGKRRADEVMTHCFFRLTFNDRYPIVQGRLEDFPPEVRGDLPAGAEPLSHVRLNFAVCREKEGGFLSTSNLSCEVGRLFIPAGKVEPMPWRSLRVDVTPERIKIFWEGRLIKSFRKEAGADGEIKEADGCDPRRILERAVLSLRHLRIREKSPATQHVIDAELALGEGLGLYVENGVAAFRSVEIEPLP
jgi:serine/threonine-protein kinase